MTADNGPYEDPGALDECEPDDYELAEMNCGSRRHRQCDLAGTEFCDWDCIFHDDVFPTRRK